MTDSDAKTNPAAMGFDDWMAPMDAIADEDGYLERLGAKHWAFFAEDSPVMLVTFEQADAIRARESKLPEAYAMAKAHGWSLLTIIADGETWWRDRAVWGYFDRLVDDAFFDDFDKVMFYGAGMAGYAACAFSVAAPGCRVLAISPRATMNPEIAGWDRRHMAARRLDFTSRYGFAPDMTEGAAQVWLVLDPMAPADAMHAALFRAPWVTRLHARRSGEGTAHALRTAGVLDSVIEDAMAGTLGVSVFARHWRARRSYGPYLKTLLAAVASAKRPELEKRICRSVTRRMKAPRFAARLAELTGANG